MDILRRLISTIVMVFGVLWGLLFALIPVIWSVVMLLCVEAIFQLADAIDGTEPT